MALAQGEGGGPRDRSALLKTHARAKLLRRLRPTVLASLALGAISERRILEAEGLRLFVDATTHLGNELLETGTYEPETVRLFRENVHPGDTVLDIGANEGFFSSLATSIVGAQGTVLAIEPQSRLHEVLEINLALNAIGTTRIFKRVVGETDTALHRIWLFPISNTGASSLVARYRFGVKSEQVREITPPTILAEAGVERIDFLKVDVEGFEPEVVRSLLPLMQAGRIGRMLIDYHAPILANRGIDPAETHTLITGCGFEVCEGTIGAGYVLYRAKA